MSCLPRLLPIFLPISAPAQPHARAVSLHRPRMSVKWRKSTALNVTLQPRDRTLTDAEIESVSQKIVAAAKATGAVLRS